MGLWANLFIKINKTKKCKWQILNNSKYSYTNLPVLKQGDTLPMRLLSFNSRWEITILQFLFYGFVPKFPIIRKCQYNNNCKTTYKLHFSLHPSPLFRRTHINDLDVIIGECKVATAPVCLRSQCLSEVVLDVQCQLFHNDAWLQ